MLSNIDNVHEDTEIAYMSGTREDVSITTEGEEIDTTDAIFDSFTLTKELKMEIFEAEVTAMANNYLRPYIILVPRSRLDKVPENFTYPIMFHGNKVYIVPYIREVLVYENE